MPMLGLIIYSSTRKRPGLVSGPSNRSRQL